MYKALYRKYRPYNFNQIIGQDHIIDILRNQIEEERISHAYIFSGVRGTGKTSTAKVFAKAVSCTNYEPEIGPCGECESCKKNEIDTIEIDAASNNSVDNIRQIKEQVLYTPTFAKYKVYIIDEVHMLSTGAFNALLKTLEEPPSHVIFILATTAIEKVPDTILSRCQRFEFRKIDDEDISKRLEYILKQEGMEYEKDAIREIVRESNGGLRDAISLLDQVFTSDKITLETLSVATGTVDEGTILDILSFIIYKNPKDALKIIDDINSKSYDIKKIPAQLISCIMHIIKDVDLDEKEKDIFKRSNTDLINQMVIELSALDKEMKLSPYPKVLLDSSIIRLCQVNKEESTDKDSYIKSLEKRLENLENMVENMEKRGVSLPKETTEDNSQGTVMDQKTSKLTAKEMEEMGEISKEEYEQIQRVKKVKEDLISKLKEDKKANLAALIVDSEIKRIIGKDIYLAFPNEAVFQKETIEKAENLEIIRRVLSTILNTKMNIHVIYEKELGKIDTEKEDRDIKKEISNKLNVSEDIIKIID